MTQQHRRTFTSDFRQFFLRGLVVLLPSVLTLWIVVKAYQFVDDNIAEPINGGIRTALLHASRVWEPLDEVIRPAEESVQAELAVRRAATGRPVDEAVVRWDLRRANVHAWWEDHWYMDLIGLLVAITAVYVAGRLLGGFFGRRIYRRVEDLITSLPVFKQVYPYVKQVVDFLFGDEKPLEFNRVVAVEYPREGIWSVGFMTGESLRSVASRAGDSVTVFIPSSPTPFTGYTITVPRQEVIDLPLTVEEAIRYAVSGGVLIPAHQSSKLPAGAVQTARGPLRPANAEDVGAAPASTERPEAGEPQAGEREAGEEPPHGAAAGRPTGSVPNR